MTNEEAKGRLESFIDTFNICKEHDNALVAVSISKEDIQAFTQAIEALEQQPCEDWYDVPSDEMTLEQARQAVKDLRKKLAEYLNQPPCEDAISRQAVLDLIIAKWHEFEDANDAIDDFIDEIRNNLPPVTPREKTAHWINKKLIYKSEAEDERDCYAGTCSACGCVQECWNYCSGCGARMVEEEE